MKRSSPLKTIAIVLAVIVLLVVVGGIAALYFMFPPQKIIALIVPQAEKALGRKVALEKAGISIYPRIGLSLSGLQVANTGRVGFSQEPFVRVEKFTASISVASIFKGYPEITSIVISRPQIRVEVDREGAFNFDDLAVMAKDTAAAKKQAPQGMPVLPVPITLKRFAIENGSIVYDDQKAGNQIVVGSVNQEVGVSMDKALRDISTAGKLVLTDVSVKTKEIKKPLKNLTITFAHDIAANLADDNGTVTVKEIRLSLQKLYITLKGSVKGALSPAPELDLALASDPFSIGDLLKEVPPELAPAVTKLTAAGTGEIGLVVKGAAAAGKPLPLQGTLGIKSLTAKFADLPQSITNGNADISFTDNSVNVKSLTLNLGTSPIDLRATVNDFKRPVIDAALKAELKLGDIKDVLELPPESSLQGSVKADVTAKGLVDPSNPATLDLKGLVDFKDVVMVWVPLLKPAKINGAFTLSSKAVANKLNVTIGESSFAMAATITNYLSFAFPDSVKNRARPRLDFTLTSPLFNLDEAIKPPEPAQETAKAEGSGSEPLLSPLPGLDMKGTVTARKIIYKGYTMSGMVAKISAVNDVMDVDFSTGFAGGTIGNKLHADLKNVRNVAFTNNLSVKAVEVNDLMQRFGGYIKPVTPLNRELAGLNKCLFGRINIQSSLSGSGGTADGIMKSIAGTIGANMAQGKIMNTPAQKVMQSSFAKFLKTDKLGNYEVINFRNLAATLHLANGNLIVDNLSIPSDAGDLLVKGSVGFDALMNMAVAMKLPKAVSSRLLAVEEAGKSVAKGLANKVLQGTQLAGAENLLDGRSLIPQDNEGRVPLKFGFDGPVASPRLSGLAFGEGTAGSAKSAQPSATPQQKVQQQVKQAVEEKKQEVQQQVEQKKEEVKVEIKKAEEQAKETVKGKLKGLKF